MTESIVPEIISAESPVPAMELAFFSFPAPILLALMINEVQQKALKKTIRKLQ